MKNRVGIRNGAKILRSATVLAAATLLLVGLPSAANAATLTIASDRATYQVSDTITLTITGDAQGAADSGVFGQLQFDPSLASVVSKSQSPLTSLGGTVNWAQGVLAQGPGFVWSFNQVAGLATLPIDAPLTATVVLHADAPGSLGLDWETGINTGNQLRFFGLTDAPGTSVRIVDRNGGTEVPEPSAAVVFGAGFLVMNWASRRRARR